MVGERGEVTLQKQVVESEIGEEREGRGRRGGKTSQCYAGLCSCRGFVEGCRLLIC